MPDPRQELDGRFRENSRFGNFGNVITGMIVKGIRCHTDTELSIRSPITAFSGLNGTGKTTLLHLAAAAYKSEGAYTISSFLAKGPLDHAPFRDDASVQLFIHAPNSPRSSLKLSYNPQSQRWQGYGRRQKREVFFFGVGCFLPLNEKRNFVFRNAGSLTLTGTSRVDSIVRTWCATILSNSYDDIKTISVQHKNQQANVLATQRGTLTYSEAHMGCGEGRVHTIVRTLESCPPKSLILLEEPEISLHAKAEYELGKYLINLANRQGHQIFITTHSERLMRSLPQASLIHLYRTDGGIAPIPGIASHEAESLMTEGHDKALTILVEDEVAQIVLTELLRHHDSQFVRTVHIAIARHRQNNGQIEASGKDAIRQAMKTLSEAGVKIAAVLDGDDVADEQNSIYKLPGTRPPEEELMQNEAVLQMLRDRYDLPMEELRGRLQEGDCHDYFDAIGRLVADRAGFVLHDAAKAYAGSVAAATVRQLITLLKEEAASR